MKEKLCFITTTTITITLCSLAMLSLSHPTNTHGKLKLSMLCCSTAENKLKIFFFFRYPLNFPLYVRHTRSSHREPSRKKFVFFSINVDVNTLTVRTEVSHRTGENRAKKKHTSEVKHW